MKIFGNKVKIPLPTSLVKRTPVVEDGVVELGPHDLRSECDCSIFDFSTTDQVIGQEEIIGQQRALKAIDFGLHIKSKNFHIYICGVPGTGKNSAVMNAVLKIAQSEPVAGDVCYLYNFKNPESPRVISFPAGYGRNFQKDMKELVRGIGVEIDEAFTAEEYEKDRRTVKEELDNERDKLNDQIQHYAESRDSELRQMFSGIAVVPRFNGRALTDEEYVKLPQEEKENIRRIQKEVSEKVYEVSRTVRQRKKLIDEQLFELDKKVVLAAISQKIEYMKGVYGQFGDIDVYLDEMRDDILQNIDAFKKEEEKPEGFLPIMEPGRDIVLEKYSVNLLIDNTGFTGAPVVVEQNPTYYNLNGYIEYKMQMGGFTTDFMMIRAGAAHRANGGYLIIEASQLIRDPAAWDSLKRILRFGEVKIENMAEHYGFVPTAGLKPQPLAVNLKVILIGNPYIFQMLYTYDEEFAKLFKVKADFDEEQIKSGTMVRQYVSLIARICHDENLRPCSREAVGKILDYSSRAAGHQNKLSTQFIETLDSLREADYWAAQDNSPSIEASHIKKSFEEKCYRSNTLEEKIQELFEENTIIIDTEGMETGQVNGVSVIDLGDYLFGKPSRITAKTFIGPGNIINIEREAEMSGRIHSKGILILSGYLGQTYAQDKPLAMSASICFEQHYEEIEGDSASSAELYCLLSSLSGLPLRQDLAVTGSVDQRGKIQPVGGINQKIEGFFKTCRLKGLTRTQGVLIPRSNMRHLMLSDEVVRAVSEGIFHIFPVTTIDEGLKILTNVEPGTAAPDGSFPKGTVHYLVNQKLLKYASVTASFEREVKEQ